MGFERAECLPVSKNRTSVQLIYCILSVSLAFEFDECKSSFHGDIGDPPISLEEPESDPYNEFSKTLCAYLIRQTFQCRFLSHGMEGVPDKHVPFRQCWKLIVINVERSRTYYWTKYDRKTAWSPREEHLVRASNNTTPLRVKLRDE